MSDLPDKKDWRVVNGKKVDSRRLDLRGITNNACVALALWPPWKRCLRYINNYADHRKMEVI